MWPKPPSLGHRFPRTSANHCAKPRSTNSPQLGSLELSLIFPVLKVSLVSHIVGETTAVLSDSTFIDPLINYLVLLPNFQIIERKVKLSLCVNTRHYFFKSLLVALQSPVLVLHI